MRSNTKLIPASTFTVTAPERPTLESDMLACVHCGSHFPINASSGKTRGFCTRCNGPVCGPGCVECVPYEQWLENREQGKPDNHRPVKVSLGGIVLP